MKIQYVVVKIECGQLSSIGQGFKFYKVVFFSFIFFFLIIGIFVSVYYMLKYYFLFIDLLYSIKIIYKCGKIFFYGIGYNSWDIIFKIIL